MLITDDLDKLLKVLPDLIRNPLKNHPARKELIEVVIDLGRRPEARFPSNPDYLSLKNLSWSDLDYCIKRVGGFSGDNRAGLEKTLHRISCIKNRQGNIVGLTCRVGRAVFGTISLIRDLLETNKSILLLGKPGVGKTTAIREIARILANEMEKRVVIIDTSNEIAGDGDVPHPSIGRARRMQVAKPELQHQVMIEAVENHMPEVIIIDEIGTELEAIAARTIAERGVQLVGTAHGNCLHSLIKNPTLSDLVGGIQQVTLGDDEAKRRGSQKSILERKAAAAFQIAVEIHSRNNLTIHDRVDYTVDQILQGDQLLEQKRYVDSFGKNIITCGVFADSKTAQSISPNLHWRNLSKPLSVTFPYKSPTLFNNSNIVSSQPSPNMKSVSILNNKYALTSSNKASEIYLYLDSINTKECKKLITLHSYPFIFTKHVKQANVILGLRAEVKRHLQLRQIAKNYQIPVYTISVASEADLSQALRRIFNIHIICE